MDINAIDKTQPISETAMTGKVCIIRKSSLLEAYHADRRLFVSGGFGASPGKIGRAVFGTMADGEEARWDRSDIEGIALDQTDFREQHVKNQRVHRTA